MNQTTDQLRLLLLQEGSSPLAKRHARKNARAIAAQGASDVALGMRLRANRAQHQPGQYFDPRAAAVADTGMVRIEPKSRKLQHRARLITHATTVVTYRADSRLKHALRYYVEGVNSRTLSRDDYRELSSWIRREKPDVTL